MVRGIRLKSETQRSEDYLEAIFHLIHGKGFASTVEISETLHVTPPTVTDMVKKLAAGGYLVHEPYRGMNLTDKGQKVAKSVIARHRIIMEFLSMLGIDEAVAYQDAEGIEHHTQPVTSRKIERLVDFLRKNPPYLKAIRDYIDDEKS